MEAIIHDKLLLVACTICCHHSMLKHFAETNEQLMKWFPVPHISGTGQTSSFGFICHYPGLNSHPDSPAERNSTRPSQQLISEKAKRVPEVTQHFSQRFDSMLGRLKKEVKSDELLSSNQI